MIFDIPTSLTCLSLIGIAYSRQKPVGYSVLQTFGDHGFSVLDGVGDVYLIFRGTDSASDWLSDINFSQKEFSGINIDSGFIRIYDDFAKQISKTPAKARVIASGHSLGAALATLAAFQLKGRAELYAFASPRVGDNAFAKVFNKNQKAPAWRIINTEDVIPTLPPAVFDLPIPFGIGDLNYTHIGKPVCFTENTGSISGNHSIATYTKAVECGTIL